MLIVIICALFVVYVYLKMKTRSVNLESKLVVITGGSSGIGKSLAIECVKCKANIVLIARNEEKLTKVADEVRKMCPTPKQIVASFIADVSDYEKIHNIIKVIEYDLGPIHMLITCAGLAVSDYLENVKQIECEQMINTNIYGTIYPVQAIVPFFKQRKSGSLVLVSSIAGIFGISGFSVYSATKFAVRGFAESLHMELKRFNISVTVSLPPDTNTPGFVEENYKKPLETKLISDNGGLYEPEVVAKKILSDVDSKKFFSTVNFQSYLIRCLSIGFAPMDSFFNLICEIFLLGFLRIVSVIILQHFYKTIRSVQNTK